MKKKMKFGLLISFFAFFLLNESFAQSNVELVDMYKHNQLKIFNRKIELGKGDSSNSLVLNELSGGGLVVLDTVNFTFGDIQLEVKGKNVEGRSFVGIAFNIQDSITYETVYLRPFNFKAALEKKRSYSVQYTFPPEFGWRKLRTESPGKYENSIEPAPDGDSWVTIKVSIEKTNVKVYVNNSDKPSLVVPRLTSTSSSKIGLFVGELSGGSFRNLQLNRRDH